MCVLPMLKKILPDNGLDVKVCIIISIRWPTYSMLHLSLESHARHAVASSRGVA